MSDEELRAKVRFALAKAKSPDLSQGEFVAAMRLAQSMCQHKFIQAATFGTTFRKQCRICELWEPMDNE
jgi:hypothetical protein